MPTNNPELGSQGDPTESPEQTAPDTSREGLERLERMLSSAAIEMDKVDPQDGDLVMRARERLHKVIATHQAGDKKAGRQFQHDPLPVYVGIELGEKGGLVINPNGHVQVLQYSGDYLKAHPNFQPKPAGAEILNRDLSPEGKNILARALGALGAKGTLPQLLVDQMQVPRKADPRIVASEVISRWEYTVLLYTAIPGINLRFGETPSIQQKITTLELRADFLERLEEEPES